MLTLKGWAADTAVRAVKTFAQTLVALFGAGAFNVLHGVDWSTDLGIAAGAALVSLLHNVQSFPLGSVGSKPVFVVDPGAGAGVPDVPDVTP